MATIKYFEDIEAWQMAAKLDEEIFVLTETGKISMDYGLKNDLRKTTGSVMDNIAEGFEINGTREFIRFLYIAKASAGEVRSQVHRAYHRKHISAEIHQDLIGKCKAISDKIYNFAKYLENSGMVGSKFMNRKTIANH